MSDSSFRRALLGSIAAFSLASCQTIDAAKMTFASPGAGFPPSVTAVAAKNDAAAKYLRKELRRGLLLRQLTPVYGGNNPLPYAWPTTTDDPFPQSLEPAFLCGVLENSIDDRQAIAQLAQFSSGLTALAADSPQTLVELVVAAQRDYQDAWSAVPATADAKAKEEYTAGCHHDLIAASLTTEKPFTTGDSYAAAAAVLGLVSMFQDVILPVLKQGATILDRQRRAEALRSYFSGANGEKHYSELRAAIERLRSVAVNQARMARMNAAADVLSARDALRAAERTKTEALTKAQTELKTATDAAEKEPDDKKKAPLLTAKAEKQKNYDALLGGCDPNPAARRTTTIQLPNDYLQPAIDEKAKIEEPPEKPAILAQGGGRFPGVSNPRCTAFLSKTFNTEINAVLDAAEKYDSARGLTPGSEYNDLQKALYQIAFGPTDAASQAKALAASLAAARSGLEALSKAEAWWEDGATKKKITDAVSKLKKEL